MRIRIFLILSLLLCSVLTWGQTYGKTYLVSVGIADYPETSNDLNLPVKNAIDIISLYKRNGIDKYHYLFDKDATAANIQQAVSDVFQHAKEEDLVVLYFCGHGLNGGFCGYDENLSYINLRKLIGKCKAKRKVIFADTCHSGSLRTKERTKEKFDGDILLFLSSRPNEVSWEFSFKENSAFTYSLLKGLRGKADINRNRVITAKELFDYVSKEVKNITHDSQHPVMWGNFDDNMCLMKW